MPTGRIVQIGAEQSLCVCTPLNLGQKVLLLTLWSVTAWDRGTVPGILLHLVCGRLANPPGVSVWWEGRSASQISGRLEINSWWFLLLRPEGGVSWGIWHARLNRSAGELWALEAECPVREAHCPQMKQGKRRRKRDWGRDCLSFGLSVKSLVSSGILRKVIPAQPSLAVPCPPPVPLPLSLGPHPFWCSSNSFPPMPSTTTPPYLSNPSCALSFSGPVHIPGLCNLQQRGKRCPQLGLSCSSRQLLISSQGVPGVVVGGTAVAFSPRLAGGSLPLLELLWSPLMSLLYSR